MKKPSHIEKIQIVFNKLIPPFKFAMTFFGKMLIKKKSRDRWNWHVRTGYSKIIINHEMIHVKQAVSTGDSWFRFYLLYIWQWIKNNPLLGWDFAYKMIPFEMEAYAKETDLYYTMENEDGCTLWKKFDKLSYTVKRAIWENYLEKRENNLISFTGFLNYYVIPTL